MNSNIDFLIIGSGIYGVTFARQLTDAGYNCLIIEQRKHIGGNCYDEQHENYYVHKYGPHVFHTSNRNVAQFITNYTKFNSYCQNTLATDGNHLYSLPFNMNTFNELFNVINPEDAYTIIQNEIEEANNVYSNRTDLEATANKLVGKTIYNKLIKNYTEKQWGTTCDKLPGDIIKRLPIRYSYDNNYFDDEFYGIPKIGYTNMINNIINGIGFDKKERKVISYICNVNFNENKKYWMSIPKLGILYCGAIDEFFDYQLGELDWRSLSFEEHEFEYNGKNGQGCAVLNDVSKANKHTRTIEHMYFMKEKIKQLKLPFSSIITKETPQKYEIGMERYYPINNEKNNNLYIKYVELLSKNYPNIILGGRIGLYKYLNMDDAINHALMTSTSIINYLNNVNK